MRKILLMIITVLICATGAGCDLSDGQNYLAFRKSGISACVTGTLELVRSDGYTPGGPCAGIGSDGRAFAFEAIITSSRSADGRLISQVEFTSPSALSGLEINYTESGANFTLNGQKDISSGELNLKIPNICSAFYIGEKIISVNPQSDGAVEIYLGDDGKSPIAIYVFEKGATLPKDIKATTEDFKLHLWDITEAK